MIKKTAVLFLVVLLGVAAYARAQDIKIESIFSVLSKEAKVLFANEPNAIMVIDYPENIKRIEEFLEVLDVPPPQVHIEARIVEVKLEGEHSLGVNWNLFASKDGMKMGQHRIFSTAASSGIQQLIPYKPTYYPPLQTITGQESPFTLTIFDDNINLVLKALANELDTTILSAPSITTVNNRAAEIEVIQVLPWAEPEVTTTEAGTDITWNINFEEVGIMLQVLPTISEDGAISMILEPEVSESTSEITLTVVSGGVSIDYTVPIIDKRTAKTKVIVGDTQTLIMGGLIKNKEIKGESKIPLFGDIPLLGYFFKSEKETVDKTELLIFVSPTIITTEEMIHMTKEEKRVKKKVTGPSILGIKRFTHEGVSETKKDISEMSKDERKKEIKKLLNGFEQKMKKDVVQK